MTQQNSDPNDVRDESITETTRRGALAALGLGGLAAVGSSGASAQLGGGPEADAMSEYRVPTYRVPESDLDSPGVVGRRVEITSGGSSYSAGDQLVDTGSSWERISAGYDSVSTDELDTDVAYQVRDDETIGEAINRATSDGIYQIHASAGTYNNGGQDLTITTDGVSIIGSSQGEVIIDTPINIEADNITIKQLRYNFKVSIGSATTTVTGGVLSHLQNRAGAEAVEFVNAERVIFVNNWSFQSSAEITLTSDTESCVVTGNARFQQINDSGTANQTTPNALTP